MLLHTLPTLLFSLGVSFLAGAIGSLFTVSNVPMWYSTLDKPPLVPSNWIFAPVWTILYILMGIALYLVIVSMNAERKKKRLAYWYFGVQLVLNTLWSVTFFGLHMVWAALAVNFGLITILVTLIRRFRPISKVASYLILPYLLWVGFATYLTFGIAVLN